MKTETRSISKLKRDILEWDIPEEVLAVLLKDRTTGRNLIWATNDYAERGKGFAANDEIQIGQIIDKNNPVIRPRVDKAAEEQHKRVKNRAEVFTPPWICNKQNNHVYASWIKLEDSPFSIKGDKSWEVNKDQFPFPCKSGDGQAFIRKLRLEIAYCESPSFARRKFDEYGCTMIYELNENLNLDFNISDRS